MPAPGYNQKPMRLVWLAVCALFTFVFAPAGVEAQAARDEPAVVEKQVEPVYPADLKSFLIEPARVEIIIDQQGVPFALKSVTGVPDNVVQALSQWRFHPARKNGDATPSAVALLIPIHRSMDRVGGLTRSWNSNSKELRDVFAAAKDLNQEKAARLEESIRNDSVNVTARLTLLVYARSLPGEDARQVRLRQILWLAKNYPTSEVLGAPDAAAASPSASEAETYEQMRQIWLGELARNPKDPAILDHATNFLRFSDPGIVEQSSLLNINETDRAAVFPGDLYAISALGVTAVDAMTGKPIAAGEQMPTTAFAEKAKTLLASTDDLRILFSALNTVSAAGPSLAGAGHVPMGYQAFCEQLLARAKTYYEGVRSKCDAIALSPASGSALRIGGQVQASKLIKQERPIYPPEAKARGITGTVSFLALIGKDGKIHRLELMSGPLALYETSRHAVSRWEYKPTLLNGDPVEVITTLDVNYTLN